MNIDRALKIRDQQCLAMRNLFSHALFFMPTHKMHLDALTALGGRYPPNTPQWVKSYVSGYHKALDETLIQPALVYGGFVNDIFYSTHRNRDDYYEKHGIAPSEWDRKSKVERIGLYWAKGENGNKPFFL